MNKSESKYFNTAVRMDEALIELLEKKEFEYITVKEICEKAGVNRSTFYLHYETIGDLLDECVEYKHDECTRRYAMHLKDIKKRLQSENLNDLIFISPEYLKPYLEFVKDNKRLFKIVLSNPAVFNAEETFKRLFTEIFSPILDRFRLPNRDKSYIISFYISGIMAIISEWIRNNCADTVERVTDICMRCVIPLGEKHLRQISKA